MMPPFVLKKFQKGIAIEKKMWYNISREFDAGVAQW